jgi:hypothetical protein
VEETFALLEFTVRERKEEEQKKKKHKTFRRQFFLRQLGTRKLDGFSNAEWCGQSGEMYVA